MCLPQLYGGWLSRLDKAEWMDLSLWCSQARWRGAVTRPEVCEWDFSSDDDQSGCNGPEIVSTLVSGCIGNDVVFHLDCSSSIKSNQMLLVTCTEYNRCRLYSEMLTYKPIPNIVELKK